MISPPSPWPVVGLAGWGLLIGILLGKYAHVETSTYLLGIGIIAVVLVGFFVRFLPGAGRVTVLLAAILIGLMLWQS